MSLSLFTLLFCGVISTNGVSLTPCELQDLDCFKTMLNDFLSQTYKGIPENDIRQSDPLIMPDFIIDFHNKNQTVSHFKNLTVTGLKKEQLQDYEMDVDEKIALFLKTINLKMIGNATVEFRKLSKSFTGTFALQGTALIDAVSDYKIEADDKGLEHVIFGPERTACETLGKLEVTLSSGMMGAINQDRSLYEHNVRNVFCTIATKAWQFTTMHNIREIAKVLPTTGLFIGLK